MPLDDLVPSILLDGWPLLSFIGATVEQLD
jgi:hypothetical protein